MNGISVLIRETPQRSLPLLPCEDTEGRWLFLYQEAGPHPHDRAGAVLSASQPPALGGIRFCCLKVTGPVAFCSNSLNRLRHT